MLTVFMTIHLLDCRTVRVSHAHEGCTIHILLVNAILVYIDTDMVDGCNMKMICQKFLVCFSENILRLIEKLFLQAAKQTANGLTGPSNDIQVLSLLTVSLYNI